MKMVSHVLLGAALVACAAAFSSPRAGGWAVVKVHTVPDAWVAGRPLQLAWEVRQHGVERLDDLRPTIEARSGAHVVTGAAWAHGGEYRGSLTIPAAGEWQVTIRSGFGRSRAVLLPWRVVDSTRAGSAAVAALPVAERGRHAFAALGCVTCHTHRAVGIAGEVGNDGPDLTERRFAADYLARFLADPSIKPPSNGRRMPNPALRETDIAPLVAFINAERRVTTR